MTVLKSLVVYWLMDGGSDNFTVPPLTDFLEPKVGKPLEPYPAYINLSDGHTPHLAKSVGGVTYISIPPAISKPLEAGVGQKLQAKGIKVVLSIFSSKCPRSSWARGRLPSSIKQKTAFQSAAAGEGVRGASSSIISPIIYGLANQKAKGVANTLFCSCCEVSSAGNSSIK